MHFKETSRSITGMEYKAWDYGPVPDNLYYELKNPPEDLNESISIPVSLSDKSFCEIKPKKKFNDKYFTKRELRILEQVAYIFKEAKAEDMTNISHLEGMPWEKTIQTKGKGHKIDYFLALDKTKNSLSLEEALERIKEKEEFKRGF
ncbi:MAG: Panacea domain-containing protein [Deltaproteobacteria bacterium]|nr:Panacea domain-containing protein [Deltaproteobacteria bacterium]